MRDWLRLLRISGLVTILSNLAAAGTSALYADGALDPAWLAQRLLSGEPWWILLSSCCLYLSGMIWNDIVDAGRDRELHPERPLPSGRIGLAPAAVVGTLLTAAALACAAQVRFGLPLAGLVLALSFFYNLVAKPVPILGSVTMAAVRGAHAVFALLALGPGLLAVTVTSGSLSAGGHWRIPPHALLLAGWIFAVTWISEMESRSAQRWELLAAGGVLAVVVTLALARLATASWIPRLWLEGDFGPPLAVLAVVTVVGLAAALAAAVLPAWATAVASGQRADAGRTVGAGLGGMILLDALIAGAAQPLIGALIAILYPIHRIMARLARMD